MFPTEEDKIAFVFRCTEGTAIRHLDSLYKTSNLIAFQTANEIIEHLADCFEELDDKADARDAYTIVRQGS